MRTCTKCELVCCEYTCTYFAQDELIVVVIHNLKVEEEVVGGFPLVSTILSTNTARLGTAAFAITLDL